MLIKAKERYYLIPVYSLVNIELEYYGWAIIGYKIVPERRLR